MVFPVHWILGQDGEEAAKRERGGEEMSAKITGDPKKQYLDEPPRGDERRIKC